MRPITFDGLQPSPEPSDHLAVVPNGSLLHLLDCARTVNDVRDEPLVLKRREQSDRAPGDLVILSPDANDAEVRYGRKVFYVQRPPNGAPPCIPKIEQDAVFQRVPDLLGANGRGTTPSVRGCLALYKLDEKPAVLESDHAAAGGCAAQALRGSRWYLVLLRCDLALHSLSQELQRRLW